MRSAVACCLLAGILATVSAGEATGRGSTLPVLDPSALPALSTEGLAVQSTNRVVLVGLDGHPLGVLRGFKLAGEFGVRAALASIQEADPALVLLQGPGKTGWLLDASGLHPLDGDKVGLPGGWSLSAAGPHSLNPVLTVSRGGVVLARSRFNVSITDGGLLVRPHFVTDLVTGERWMLRHGATWTIANRRSCVPSRRRGHELVAVCASNYFKGKVWRQAVNVQAFSITETGVRTALSPPFEWGFGALTADISPDGRNLAVTLAVGCGAPPVYVASTDGGAWRKVLDHHSDGFTSTHVIGWSLGGKITAVLNRPRIAECGGDGPSGVYLIDPDTLGRVLIYATRADAVLWKPAPR